jgi:uncharacterized membrane protein
MDVNRGVSCLFLLLLPALVYSSPETIDEITHIFYIGDAFAYSITPYYHLKEEPPFGMTAIPTYNLDLMRAMRHYMPRTYEDHVEKNDVVLMSDAVRDLFNPNMVDWIGRGVIEAGQGLLMVGGWGSFGAMVGLPSWSGSKIEEALPCLSVDQTAYEGSGVLFPLPIDPKHEFCAPLPWKRAPPFDGMNTVIPKQGSVEILLPRATIGTAQGPILVYWEVGRGTGLANTPDLTYGWVGSFGEWEFYGDYCVNLIYMLARLGVPQDTSLVHSARTAIQNYVHERELLIGMAEFIDSFGANLRPIEKGLGEIAEMKAWADSQYIDQDFLGAIDTLNDISARVLQLGEEATRLKNRALLWVFIAEWFTVTATLMITGYIVWSLMIRRRLYRDVVSTKLVERGQG